MSDYFRVLKEAHALGVRKLDELQALVAEIKEGRADDAQDRLTSFFDFVDRELVAHFRQEEDVLFPALEEVGLGVEPLRIGGEEAGFCYLLTCEDTCRASGPLNVYRREHEIIYERLDSLRKVARNLGSGLLLSEKEAEQLGRAVDELEYWLGSHIAKENAVLLPAAEELLGDERMAAL